MDVHFVTLDVFTSRTFGGNPLAVIPDARGLTSGQMQAIASEFNYSEATFVLPSDEPSDTAKVRIFTPANEIPFAGHPNVGTAVALARAGEVFGKSVGDKVRFDEGVGSVDIDILRDGTSVVGARFTAPGATSLGPMYEEGSIAECVGIEFDEIVSANHLPRQLTLGISFVFAEVRDLLALRRAAPLVDRFKKHLPTEEVAGLYLYARTYEGSSETIRSRMFSPIDGIGEDPATGSAAAMLGTLLGKLIDGDHDLSISIDQGIEMGRPSNIEVGVQRDADGIRSIVVGGNAVPVSAGVLTI